MVPYLFEIDIKRKFDIRNFISQDEIEHKGYTKDKRPETYKVVSPRQSLAEAYVRELFERKEYELEIVEIRILSISAVIILNS